MLTLAWSPDAKILASGGMDGMVWLWSPDKGEPLGSCRVRIVPGIEGFKTAVGLSSDVSHHLDSSGRIRAACARARCS